MVLGKFEVLGAFSLFGFWFLKLWGSGVFKFWQIWGVWGIVGKLGWREVLGVFCFGKF